MSRRGDALDGETLGRFVARPEARPASDECACGATVAWARVYGTEDVVPLDANADGSPRCVRRGEYTALSTTADVLGRQPLVVDVVEERRGQHVDHRLLCVRRAS